MNAGRIARLLWHLLALVVLVVSGAYLLIYLHRWEWNRALVSGLFLVAAEVVLVGVVLSAIAYLVERLAAATAPVIGDEGSARRLAALEPLRGGLVPSTRTGGVPGGREWDLVTPGPRLVHVGSALTGAVVLLVSALLATSLVSVLWDVAVNRPDSSSAR